MHNANVVLQSKGFLPKCISFEHLDLFGTGVYSVLVEVRYGPNRELIGIEAAAEVLQVLPTNHDTRCS